MFDYSLAASVYSNPLKREITGSRYRDYMKPRRRFYTLDLTAIANNGDWGTNCR